MKDYENEVRLAVKRAGSTASWMSVFAFVTLVGGVLVGLLGGGIALVVVAVAAAALIHGVGTAVDLLGRQLMETWRQGRRAAANEET
ncbi:hypothetical protein [Glycomyces terrestris]|uniref:Uncharacterized protein n=1 Tax=Glycomyces terrestris TaxID=2493553 RepID=A0A426V0Q8_9ACTN|nr:hypothetical protein [Glycomyces terrestris]RRS00405.1 hypothetical protein EIW28_07495 [Glycomyces terrestris]